MRFRKAYYLVFILLPLRCLFAGWLHVGWMDDSDRMDSVRTVKAGNIQYVDMLDLAERLGIKYQRNSSGDRLCLAMSIQNLVFTSGSPFVLIGSEVRQLELPLPPAGKRFLAPTGPLVDLLSEFYHGELLYDPSEPKLLASSPRYDLFTMIYQVEPGVTRILLPAHRQIECVIDTTYEDRVKLFFPSGTIDTLLFQALPAEGLVTAVKASGTADGAELTFMPENDAMFSGLIIDEDPPLYTLEFVSRTGYVKKLSDEEQRRLDEDRSKWALDVVVIDPGHGGKDPGAVGVTGLYEKIVTLDVGLRLRDELKKRGVKTVMTRDRDVFIPLAQRTRIANNSGGKLFISLHANSLPKGKAYGMETYFMAPVKTERAMKVAMKENSVIKYEESRDQYQDLTEENFILLTMAQANFVRESQELAAIVQNKTAAGVSLKDRGVDQAGFYVLIGASMPSILVEMGFISTRKEERKLRDKNFRQKMAEELCKSIMKFLEDHKSF